MHFLVTGAAGFIGAHLCQRLLERGAKVTGIDNLNDYYDVQLKRDRLTHFASSPDFTFQQFDLADRTATEGLFCTGQFDCVIHLAAQAGVRYSLDNPHAYVDSNLVAFTNVLEGCRHQRLEHLIYASSSSVYGENKKIPFSIHDEVNHQVSLYAATKRANELMAHTYSQLYDLRITGLRFFTVYGPWGRPDMAIYQFTQAILSGEPIKVYNHGRMRRDFTYIDDIVDGVLGVADMQTTEAESAVNHRLYNLGNNQPVELGTLIATLEATLGREAKKHYVGMQPGDVVETYADIQESTRDFGFAPRVSIAAGLERFVEWYRNYHEKKRLPFAA